MGSSFEPIINEHYLSRSRDYSPPMTACVRGTEKSYSKNCVMGIKFLNCTTKDKEIAMAEAGRPIISAGDRFSVGPIRWKPYFNKL